MLSFGIACGAGGLASVPWQCMGPLKLILLCGGWLQTPGSTILALHCHASHSIQVTGQRHPQAVRSPPSSLPILTQTIADSHSHRDTAMSNAEALTTLLKFSACIIILPLLVLYVGATHFKGKKTVWVSQESSRESPACRVHQHDRRPLDRQRSSSSYCSEYCAVFLCHYGME